MGLLEGQWYFLNENGEMLTNSVTPDGKVCWGGRRAGGSGVETYCKIETGSEAEPENTKRRVKD